MGLGHRVAWAVLAGEGAYVPAGQEARSHTGACGGCLPATGFSLGLTLLAQMGAARPATWEREAAQSQGPDQTAGTGDGCRVCMSVTHPGSPGTTVPLPAGQRAQCLPEPASLAWQQWQGGPAGHPSRGE